jgi:hypothetical protein
MVPFEETPDEILRKVLTSRTVGLDQDAEITPTCVLYLSKFEGYGLLPSHSALYTVLVDVVRKCFILTKALLSQEKNHLYV